MTKIEKDFELAVEHLRKVTNCLWNEDNYWDKISDESKRGWSYVGSEKDVRRQDKAYRTVKKAQAYLRELQFPLITKPMKGSK